MPAGTKVTVYGLTKARCCGGTTYQQLRGEKRPPPHSSLAKTRTPYRFCPRASRRKSVVRTVWTGLVVGRSGFLSEVLWLTTIGEVWVNLSTIPPLE